MIFYDYLHLGTAILEPEFDLSGFQAKPLAKLHSLFLIRMRALLEQTICKINPPQKKGKKKSRACHIYIKEKSSEACMRRPYASSSWICCGVCRW